MKFSEFFFQNWRFWKMYFFWVGHFEFFFFKKKNFFCLILTKTCQSLLVSKKFSKFWWLPWFPSKNQSPQTFQPTVYRNFMLESIYIINIYMFLFQAHLGLSREDFMAAPRWKQLEIRKEKGLFWRRNGSFWWKKGLFWKKPENKSLKTENMQKRRKEKEKKHCKIKKKVVVILLL